MEDSLFSGGCNTSFAEFVYLDRYLDVFSCSRDQKEFWRVGL